MLALADALAVTEREILATKEAVRQHMALLYHLYAKRNSLLPVSRLPLEILTSIFIYGACDYYESNNGGRFAPQIPSWVNVSYVCSHWRDIALGCPTLWTYHFNASLRWTKELLLRSRKSPLKISCLYLDDQDEEISRWRCLLEELLKHSERIEELSLDLPPGFLPPKFSVSVPCIEFLAINLRWDDPDQSIAITNGSEHTLSFLQLENCSLSWHLLNLNSLDVLFLHCVQTPSPLDMTKFLVILSNMRYLTILHLHRVLSTVHDFPGSSTGLGNSSKVDLPRLTRVVIAEPLPKLIAFLSYVNIPLRASLELEPGFESGQSLDASVLLSSFLAGRYSQSLEPSGLIFRSLRIHTGLLTSLTFGLECTPLSDMVDYEDTPLKIILMADDEDTGDIVLTESDTDRVINSILSSLPLKTIQALHITESRQFSPDFWRDTLGRLHKLQCMKLSNGNMPDLSLLSLIACESDEDQNGQPFPDQDATSHHKFVPGLETLELHRIKFTPDHTLRPGGMSQRSLLDALSTRKRLLGQLIVSECGIIEDE